MIVRFAGQMPDIADNNYSFVNMGVVRRFVVFDRTAGATVCSFPRLLPVDNSRGSSSVTTFPPEPLIGLITRQSFTVRSLHPPRHPDLSPLFGALSAAVTVYRYPILFRTPVFSPTENH